MKHNAPNPMEMAEAPELAILHALAEIVDLAQGALLAAHPDLEQADFFPDAPPLTVDAWLADSLLVHLGALEAAIGRYRGHLRSREALRTLRSPADI